MEERDEHEGRGRLSTPRLRRGTPERAGLDAGELRRLVQEVRARTEGPRPWAAGAVVVAGRGPVIAVEEAAGWAVRYSGCDEHTGAPVELPPERRVPMTVDTPFDLASVTKLFTSVAAVQQIERGTLGLDARVGTYLPDFTAAVRHGITVRQLRTRRPVTPAPARVVRKPQIRKGQVLLDLCETDPALDRATVTKRHGALYRAARDTDWGDPWPPPSVSD
ncbi:hypothetical protein SALBM217S_04623 [Streptomyces griseoloalbus]